MDTKERIGEAIREARKARGWKLEELAERCGIGRSHVGRIECGKYNSTVDKIERVAEALDMELQLVKKSR